LGWRRRCAAASCSLRSSHKDTDAAAAHVPPMKMAAAAADVSPTKTAMVWPLIPASPPAEEAEVLNRGGRVASPCPLRACSDGSAAGDHGAANQGRCCCGVDFFLWILLRYFGDLLHTHVFSAIYLYFLCYILMFFLLHTYVFFATLVFFATTILRFCYNRIIFLLQLLYDFATIEQRFCYDVSDEIFRRSLFCYGSIIFLLRRLRRTLRRALRRICVFFCFFR
jgi:hypothetical protein